jgi:hypothetical protein
MFKIGNQSALLGSIEYGHYSSKKDNDPMEVNSKSIREQQEMLNDEVVVSALKMLNTGILYSQMEVSLNGKPMKPTMERFFKKYWKPIAPEIKKKQFAFGFCPIAFRKEKARFAKDFKELFPNSTEDKVEALVPYIPLMSEIVVEAQVVKGYVDYRIRFRQNERPSNNLFIYFGDNRPDFDIKTKTIISDLYKLRPVYEKMKSVEHHIMSNISLNVNPSLMIQKKDLSKEDERLRARDTENRYAYEMFMQLQNGPSNETEDVALNPEVKSDDVADRTNQGQIIAPIDNVTVLPENYQVVSGLPQSRFPIADMEFARNRFIVDVCANLGIPNSYFSMTKSKVTSNMEDDRTKLLESRQDLVAEITDIMEDMWFKMYDDVVEFRLDILPVATTEEFLQYLQLGMIDPKQPNLETIFYHLSGVKIDNFNIKLPTEALAAGAGAVVKRQKSSSS